MGRGPLDGHDRPAGGVRILADLVAPDAPCGSVAQRHRAQLDKAAVAAGESTCLDSLERREDVTPRDWILTGDCSTAFVGEGRFDLLVADPPYGDAALG